MKKRKTDCLSGKLNKRITIESRSKTQNSYGELLDTWTPLKNIWAGIDPLSGRDFVAAKADQSEISHEITVRDGKDIKPNMRVVFGSRIFDIKAVLNINEAGREYVIMANEVFVDE
ncbi:MAG: phage head closure protein [Dethiosulfatibacter sp.]|nr:phage head closure protein [Dethiosulfatibacter sp.]